MALKPEASRPGCSGAEQVLGSLGLGEDMVFVGQRHLTEVRVPGPGNCVVLLVLACAVQHAVGSGVWLCPHKDLPPPMSVPALAGAVVLGSRSGERLQPKGVKKPPCFQMRRVSAELPTRSTVCLGQAKLAAHTRGCLP